MFDLASILVNEITLGAFIFALFYFPVKAFVWWTRLCHAAGIERYKKFLAKLKYKRKIGKGFLRQHGYTK